MWRSKKVIVLSIIIRSSRRKIFMIAFTTTPFRVKATPAAASTSPLSSLSCQNNILHQFTFGQNQNIRPRHRELPLVDEAELAPAPSSGEILSVTRCLNKNKPKSYPSCCRNSFYFKYDDLKIPLYIWATFIRKYKVWTIILLVTATTTSWSLDRQS